MNNAKSKRKECKHNFKHIVNEFENLKGENFIWLIHKCKKCGIEDDTGLRIGERLK